MKLPGRALVSMDELRALPVGSVVLWTWRNGRTLSAEKIGHGNGWSEGSYEQFEPSFERGNPTCTVLWTPSEEQISRWEKTAGNETR